MRQFIFLILIFLAGCINSERKEKEIKEEKIGNQTEFEQDTILERTNPKSLDLTKHQLFIDTTRNSKFYIDLLQWAPSKLKNKTVNTYLKELNKISKLQKVDFRNFPKRFVKINKIKGDFLLYDRCDGIDPRYELRDSAFIFYGPLESDAETINKVYQINSEGIKVLLNSFEAKTSNRVSTLEIFETEYQGIYSLKYKNENYLTEEYIIPIKNITNFDLVVNNCPITKVREYFPFFEKER